MKPAIAQDAMAALSTAIGRPHSSRIQRPTIKTPRPDSTAQGAVQAGVQEWLDLCATAKPARFTSGARSPKGLPHGGMTPSDVPASDEDRAPETPDLRQGRQYGPMNGIPSDA